MKSDTYILDTYEDNLFCPITVRDYIAIEALKSIITQQGNRVIWELAAKAAYEAADALIKQSTIER